MNEELKVIITAEISDLQQSVSEAQEAVGDFATEADNASSQTESAFGGMSATAAAKFALVETAIQDCISAIKDMISSAASYGDTIDKQSQKMQMSTQAYQEWSYVLQRNGTDINSLKKGINTITQDLGSMAAGVDVDTSAYDALGVSLKNADGSMKSSEQVMSECIMSLADMDDVTQRNALAQQIFGKGFTELLPLLNNTSSDIQDLIDVADEYAVISDEDIAKSAEFADAQLTMQMAFQAFTAEIAGVLLPVLSEMFAIITEIINFMTENQGLMEAIAITIGVLTTAIGLYNAVQAIKAAMDAAEVTTLGALVAAKLADAAATMVALAPYVLIVAAIAAVIAIIVTCIKHWDEIKEVIVKVWETIVDAVTNAVEAVIGFFQNLMDKIKEIVSAIFNFVADKFNAIKTTMSNIIEAAKNTVCNIFEAIKSTISSVINAISSTVSSVFNTIKNAITTPIQAAQSTVSSVFNSIKSAISNTINGARDVVKNAIDKIKSFFNFSWSLPHLKMPHVTISGSFSLVPPKVPKFSLDWYAQGGVFDQTTLFTAGGRLGGLGEDGAEAIVPLENNTEWLNRLADMLNERMGGRDIYLQIDGKTFAEVSVNSINELTRQRGSLPLKLV